MTNASWLPSLWGDKDSDPFDALRKSIDETFHDWGKGLATSDKSSFSVSSNVSETDKEICITADLPGVEEKDIDVSISGDRITIKGERKSEQEEKKEDDGREFHRVERSYGSFQRSMSLPFKIDSDNVTADFKNGVLTVNIPKPPEEIQNTKKIEVKTTS